MITRSSATPNSGASTSTTSGRAIHVGQPHPGRVRQLPVHVREEHADRALGEVEDAGRRVDDDQPARRHRVDAGERQREHQAGSAGWCALTGFPAHACTLTTTMNTIVAAQTSRFDHRWFTSRAPSSAELVLALVFLHRVDRELERRLVVVAVERARLDRVDAHELAVLHLHADEARAPDLPADVDLAGSCRRRRSRGCCGSPSSRFARVIEFGSSSWAFIVSLTAWAKISPATHACAPKPSGFLSYLRKVSSVGVGALVLERQDVQPHVLALDRADRPR